MSGAATKARPDTGPLYKSEDEIAQLVGLTEAEWQAMSCVLEREGLPKVSPLARRRYWPAVKAFLDDMEGVGQHSFGANGRAKENFS